MTMRGGRRISALVARANIFEFQTASAVIARSESDEAIHLSSCGDMDCFASLAMTWKHTRSFSRRVSPELLQIHCPSANRGRRESRVPTAPAVSCAKSAHCRLHTSIQVQPKHPDFPRATALRLTSCSPRWSGLVVTVIPEKLASQELDASIAASGPHDFAVRSGTIRL
jgi:hypothetical protein